MKFQLPERAFAPLVLSAREEQDLIDEADRIIEATIAAQEQYIARGRQVQSDQWKHFRSKEGMNVYRQRSVGASKKLFDPIAMTSVAATATSTATTGSDRRATRAESWLPIHRNHHGNSSTNTMKVTSPASLSRLHAAQTPGGRVRRPPSTPMVESHIMPASPASSSMSNADFTHTHTNSNSNGSDSSEWMEYQRKPSHVPGILAVGVVDGRLEDAMYGVFSDDDASWRWKSSQINDKLDDARVLATIRGPTREDPFRFIGVKWFTKEHPTALHSIVKRRDFLTIEAMGTTYDATGKVRLGYFMMHSIEIPRIPVLSDLNILRGQASMCFILRQVQNSAIEVFARGFSDPHGEMLEGISVRLASDSILAAVRIVDFAHIKKLRWLMIHRRNKNPEHDENSVQNENNKNESENKDENQNEKEEVACRTCHKRIRRLSSLFQGSAANCQVCHDVVCARCTITKHVTIDISIDGATQKPLPFCLPCVMEAKNLPAWDIALGSVTQKQYSLLPTDLFTAKATEPVVREDTSDRKRRDTEVEQSGKRDLRRVPSAPRIQRTPVSNSRSRSASSQAPPARAVLHDRRKQAPGDVLLVST